MAAASLGKPWTTGPSREMGHLSSGMGSLAMKATRK